MPTTSSKHALNSERAATVYMRAKACLQYCTCRHTYSLISQVLADGYQVTKDGLIFKDFEEGQGASPSGGQVSEMVTLRHAVVVDQMMALAPP